VPATHPKRRFLSTFVGITLAVLVADQVTKPLVVYFLGRGVERDLPSFFAHYFTLFWRFPYRSSGHIVTIIGRYLQINFTTNDGMAWGLLKGHPLELSLISLVLCILIWWLWRTYGRSGLYLTASLGLIMGGAVGNLIDRFRLKVVVDFVDTLIPIVNYDFPVFNIADAAASIGTLMIVIYLFWLDGKRLRRRKRLRVVDLTEYHA